MIGTNVRLQRERMVAAWIIKCLFPVGILQTKHQAGMSMADNRNESDSNHHNFTKIIEVTIFFRELRFQFMNAFPFIYIAKTKYHTIYIFTIWSIKYNFILKIWQMKVPSPNFNPPQKKWLFQKNTLKLSADLSKSNWFGTNLVAIQWLEMRHYRVELDRFN